METEQNRKSDCAEEMPDHVRLRETEGYGKLMMEYQCALDEVQTKMEVLNKELSMRTNRNPFESIKSRIKTPESICGKMHRKGMPCTLESIEKSLTDIAGIRVICSFIDDIYMLVECLEKQDDLEVVEVKDYIQTPKPSGYRSLHVIVRVPIFLSDGKHYRIVEVQFRTIAMDFWASLEHKLRYKQDIAVEDAQTIADDLRFNAELINQVDRRMQQIREHIDSGANGPNGQKSQAPVKRPAAPQGSTS
ncbi:MAG: GTP pyrophosphokinase family protein [Lachnospiraceae bacterium]|jgi:putative GTP pyrophosphokinase|nr:GTP pyrophosphokinase family protein [Lachnospiraceae bacterium]